MVNSQSVTPVFPLPRLYRPLLQKTYPFVCPGCHGQFNAMPSELMRSGYNSGNCQCLSCGESLHLEINDTNDGMTATKWSEWFDEYMSAEATP